MPESHATTRYFENTEKMCRDLLASLPSDLCPECLGFLTASSQSQHSRLMPELQRRVPIPVVGGTTLVSPFGGQEGETAAHLTVLGRRGVKYAAVLSEPLREFDEKRQMARLVERCRTRLGAEPKLFLVVMPIVRHMSANRYLKPLFEKAGDVPVFGGMVSDDFRADNFAVFAEGASHADRMVLVGVSGEVEPVWSVGCDVTPLSDMAPTVTASYNNVIYGIDDMTFCDYLRKLGLAHDIKSMADFSLALVISGGISDHDGVPEVVHLTATDPALGCGIVTSDITPGCRVTLGHLTRDAIHSSARRCLDDLSRKMKQREEQGYTFGGIFCIPCLGRYFASAEDAHHAEGGLIRDAFPPEIPLFGYYGFNEVCPTAYRSGNLLNRAHSDSIALCAW